MNSEGGLILRVGLEHVALPVHLEDHVGGHVTLGHAGGGAVELVFADLDGEVAVVGGDKSVLIDAAADVTELFFDFVCRCHKFRLLFYTVLQKVVAFPVHSCYHLIKINQNKLYLAAILIISPL